MKAMHCDKSAQVRVLELESDLSRERERLGQLRRAHYHLAGETEVRLRRPSVSPHITKDKSTA
jgi:hypothetical protein